MPSQMTPRPTRLAGLAGSAARKRFARGNRTLARVLDLNLLVCSENPQGKLDHAGELDAAGNSLMNSTRSPGMPAMPWSTSFLFQ